MTQDIRAALEELVEGIINGCQFKAGAYERARSALAAPQPQSTERCMHPSWEPAGNGKERCLLCGAIGDERRYLAVDSDVALAAAPAIKESLSTAAAPQGEAQAGETPNGYAALKRAAEQCIATGGDVVIANPKIVLDALQAANERAERAETAQAHTVMQAGCQAQEARTQRSIVLDILKALDLPLRDWEACGLVVGKFSDLRAQLAAQQADAARYRFLRDVAPWMGNRVPHVTQYPPADFDGDKYLLMQIDKWGMDAAIDAALQAGGEG